MLWQSILGTKLSTFTDIKEGIFLALGPMRDLVMDAFPCELFRIQTDYLPTLSRYANTDDRFALWNQFPPLGTKMEEGKY